MKWRLDPEKTGLLLMDLQEKLVPAIAEGDKVVERCVLMAKVARLFSIPVFMTEQAPEKLGPTVARVREAVEGVTLISKVCFSAASVLPDLPRTLLVAGLETHICVRQTVYDLRAKSSLICLLGDAVGSRRPLDHALALEELRRDGVLVASVEAVIWEMLASVEHPQFKQVQALIKA